MTRRRLGIRTRMGRSAVVGELRSGRAVVCAASTRRWAISEVRRWRTRWFCETCMIVSRPNMPKAVGMPPNRMINWQSAGPCSRPNTGWTIQGALGARFRDLTNPELRDAQ